MKILLVEDDPMLGMELQTALRSDSHAVDWFRLGEEGLSALASSYYDLLILDLGLPDRDGMEVLKTLRRNGKDLPVLILTARDGIGDRVDGLDAGADDYLLKPFDLNELLARLRALARRTTEGTTTELSHGELTLDTRSHAVTCQTMPINLSRREYMLLEILIKRPGQVFTRQQLEETLYSWDDDIGSNAVEVHVHHVRKKMPVDVIKTVRGIGYRLGSCQ